MLNVHQTIEVYGYLHIIQAACSGVNATNERGKTKRNVRQAVLFRMAGFNVDDRINFPKLSQLGKTFYTRGLSHNDERVSYSVSVCCTCLKSHEAPLRSQLLKFSSKTYINEKKSKETII